MASMEMNQADPIQHPPLMRDTLPMFKPRTVWPVVIGAIAAVFGGFGMLGGLINMASPLLMSIMPRMPAGQPDPFGGMAAWTPWLVGIGIVTTLVGGLLLMGAITLLRRHHASRLMLLSWAMLKAVLVVASTYVGYRVNQAQMAAMMQSGGAGSPLTGWQGIAQAMGIVGVVIGLLWGWALPLFFFIWFMRPRIAREVAEWKGAISN